MSATTAVAIYAAVVATGGLTWNVASWWLDRRTKLAVRADYSPEIPALTVVITNQSTFEVAISAIHVDWIGEDGERHGRVLGEDFTPDDDQGLLRTITGTPKKIAARDFKHVFAGGAAVANALPPDPHAFRVMVGLAHGPSVTAPVRVRAWGEA